MLIHGLIKQVLNNTGTLTCDGNNTLYDKLTIGRHGKCTPEDSPPGNSLPPPGPLGRGVHIRPSQLKPRYQVLKVSGKPKTEMIRASYLHLP